MITQWYQWVNWLRGLDLNQRPSGYEAVAPSYNSLIPLIYLMVSIVYSKVLHILSIESTYYRRLKAARNLLSEAHIDEL